MIGANAAHTAGDVWYVSIGTSESLSGGLKGLWLPVYLDLADAFHCASLLANCWCCSITHLGKQLHVEACWMRLHCRNVNNEGDYEKVTVPGERADAVVQEDVMLLKLDVEGFEPQAFASSQGILDGHS